MSSCSPHVFATIETRIPNFQNKNNCFAKKQKTTKQTVISVIGLKIREISEFGFLQKHVLTNSLNVLQRFDKI